MAMVGMGNPASLSRLAPDEPLKPPAPAPPGAPPAASTVPPASYAAPAPAGRTWGPNTAAAGHAPYASPSTGKYSTPPVAPAPAAPTPAPAALVTPTAPAAPATAGVDTNQLAPEQQELLQQVLALTPEQIQAMGPEQRATIIALRQQFGS